MGILLVYDVTDERSFNSAYHIVPLQLSPLSLNYRLVLSPFTLLLPPCLSPLSFPLLALDRRFPCSLFPSPSLLTSPCPFPADCVPPLLPLTIPYRRLRAPCLADIRTWHANIEQHASEGVNKILIGNKSDWTEKRAVTEEQGRELANELGIKFMETSAKINEGVEEAFFTLARCVISLLVALEFSRSALGLQGVTAARGVIPGAFLHPLTPIRAIMDSRRRVSSASVSGCAARCCRCFRPTFYRLNGLSGPLFRYMADLISNLLQRHQDASHRLTSRLSRCRTWRAGHGGLREGQPTCDPSGRRLLLIDLMACRSLRCPRGYLCQGQETTVCCALVYIGLSVWSNVFARLSTLATPTSASSYSPFMPAPRGTSSFLSNLVIYAGRFPNSLWSSCLSICAHGR